MEKMKNSALQSSYLYEIGYEEVADSLYLAVEKDDFLLLDAWFQTQDKLIDQNSDTAWASRAFDYLDYTSDLFDFISMEKGVDIRVQDRKFDEEPMIKEIRKIMKLIVSKLKNVK